MQERFERQPGQLLQHPLCLHRARDLIAVTMLNQLQLVPSLQILLMLELFREQQPILQREGRFAPTHQTQPD